MQHVPDHVLAKGERRARREAVLDIHACRQKHTPWSGGAWRAGYSELKAMRA